MSRQPRFRCAISLLLVAGLLFPVRSASQARTTEDTPPSSNPAAVADDGFVPVDISGEASVNGKLMMILAYCIILGGLLAYAFSLVKREQTVNREIRDLMGRLKGRPDKRE